MNPTNDKNNGFGNDSAGKSRQEFGAAAGADKMGSKSGLHDEKSGQGQQAGHDKDTRHADAGKKPGAERDYKS